MRERTKILNIIILTFVLLTGVFWFSSNNVEAYGECSKYGLMAYYDSFTNSCKCMSGYVFGKGILGDTYCISKDQWCRDKYGFNAMSDFLSDSCKCMSGYVFGKDIFGNTKCVSADQLCKDQYGVMTRYNSLFDKCECFIGYVFGEDILGRTQCISENEWCRNKYGFNSKYNILKDKCECKSGYELTIKSGGGLECVSCFLKYGLHSSYNYLSDKCECSDGYTLDDNNQCIEKQNNVYFLLKELNTDDNEAIIQSEYDYQNYLITYGYGCYDSSIKRYLNNRIIINLGTDFDVDIWDKIVLPDDNEVCEILSVKRISSSFSFIPICPENSYLATDNNCYCKTGYELNSNQTICIKSVICSSNSKKINNECVCNQGYIMKNNKCITPTEDCINEYGSHVYGEEKNSNSSFCYCVDGYEWNLSQTACIKIEIPKEKEEPQVENIIPKKKENSLNDKEQRSQIEEQSGLGDIVIEKSQEQEEKQKISILTFVANIFDAFKNFFIQFFK